MAGWITIIVSAITGLLGISQVDSFVTGFVQAHPSLTLVLTAASTILAVLLKSPRK